MTASLRETEIGAGESTQLTVSVTGSNNVGKPLLPDVQGLTITPRGQSTQMQYINGSLSTQITFLYNVQAEREGKYHIPPIQMRIAGQIIETDPLSLTVSAAGGLGAPSGQANANKPGLGTFGFGQQPAQPKQKADQEPALLRVRIPRNHAYVGELLPIEIKAYFDSSIRVTLNSQPQLSGGAFTLHNLSNEPRQNQELMGGRAYTVLTWSSALSAIKEGDLPVSASLNATLLIRERRRTRDPFEDIFNHDLFDDDFFGSFFGTTSEKSLTLKSPDLQLSVLPLPEDGKPDDYGGAVGSFTMDVSATSKEVTAGDPVTQKIRIKGMGNFDRVSKPTLVSDGGFKTYSPEVSFKSLDTMGYQGEKFFEQVLIPQDEKVKEIPPVRFSYFDPDKAQYVLLSSNPIPLKVRPADAQAGSRVQSPAATATPSDVSPSPVDGGGIAPIHLERGTTVSSLTPALMNRGLQGLLLLSALGLILSGAIRRMYHKRRDDPEFAPRLMFEEQTRETYAAADKAISEGSAQDFLFACRRIAQLRLSRMWQVEPEAITLSDLREHRFLECPNITKIFEMADAVAFSGLTLGIQELKTLFKAFKEEVERLK